MPTRRRCQALLSAIHRDVARRGPARRPTGAGWPTRGGARGARRGGRRAAGCRVGARRGARGAAGWQARGGVPRGRAAGWPARGGVAGAREVWPPSGHHRRGRCAAGWPARACPDPLGQPRPSIHTSRNPPAGAGGAAAQRPSPTRSVRGASIRADPGRSMDRLALSGRFGPVGGPDRRDRGPGRASTAVQRPIRRTGRGGGLPGSIRRPGAAWACRGRSAGRARRGPFGGRSVGRARRGRSAADPSAWRGVRAPGRSVGRAPGLRPGAAWACRGRSADRVCYRGPDAGPIG